MPAEGTENYLDLAEEATVGRFGEIGDAWPKPRTPVKDASA